MGYEVQKTTLPGVLILTPRVFEDDRGFFFESFNQRSFNDAINSDEYTFVQDNHSRSVKGTLRGLHFQHPNPQGKLVRVVSGAVFDVAVDIRNGSPTFGNWFGLELSAANKKQLWIPPGLAHGFLTLSDEAEFLYKTTDYYAPAHEHTLIWGDKDLAIQWPISEKQLVISNKDKNGFALSSLSHFQNI